MTIEIKKLGIDDVALFSQMVKSFEEIFEMKNFNLPPMLHLQNTLQKENFMAFVALFEQKIAGGMTVYILDQYYSEKRLAYIFDLAVLPKYQHKGIGTQMINFIKRYCKERDFEEIFVQADAIDEYALSFYRSTGISEEEDVRHFYYTL
jgi:aminoglycoside 3-N-acetyltransferase I